MRAVIVLALLLGGCVAESDADPGVSVTYSRQQQNDSVRITASLTGVEGPIDDWSDLRVTGCVAPAKGPIDVPHRFSSCSGDLTIRYAPTGETLYSSR